MADAMNECVIEWIRGEKTASVTMPNNTRLKTKILKLASDNACAMAHQNKDGSIFAHVPVEWIRIQPPKKMNWSEEQLKLRRERLKELRQKQQGE